MKRIAMIFAAVAALTISLGLNAQGVISRSGIENPDKWINSVFAKDKLPPFSFAYEEISSGKFISEWQFSKKKLQSSQKGVVEYLVTWTDPSNTVRVSCNVKGFTGYNAVEWTVRFKNISRHNSSKIAVIRAADYKVNEPAANGFTARLCNGFNGTREDFQTEEFDLRAGVIRNYTPEDGLSSKGQSLPFYNIIARGADAGAVMAIGWTGRWNAELRGTTSLEYKLHAGLEKANFYLRPGEEVRTPLVATVFWKGSEVSSGENAFRRFVLAHHSPKVGGRPWAPLAGGFDFGNPEHAAGNSLLTEDLAVATVQRFKQLGLMPEVFVLEQGWNAAEGDWHANQERFPDGLGNIARQIHAYGGKFMAEMPVENIGRGTALVKEHPEYLLVGDKGAGYIFDFSQPKAVDFICRHIASLMEEGGIDGLVCSVSGNLGKYWDAADERDRTGIVEMKYVAGLYRFWDYILKNFPGCAMDNSSAGARLDLEAISRSVALLRRDSLTPEAVQCRQYCLNMFVPLQTVVATSSDPYICRSCLGGAFTGCFNLFAKGGDSAEMRARQSEWAAAREYLLKDYYPLCGTTPILHNDIWVAEQFHDSKSGCGIIVAFRRSFSENVTFAAGLKGLDPDAGYTLYDFDTKESVRVSGAQLAKGCRLSLKEPRSSILIKYEKE